MSYRNNGRGPDIKEHSRFAPDGTLASFEVKGKSTFGAPIDESYTRNGGTARWRSLADRGEATVTRAVAYVPVDSSFSANATIVRAALGEPGNRIAALPGGELTVRKVLERRLESGAQNAAVALYAVLGIDTQPDFIWLTGGANPRLFALVIPGFARIVEQGWEGQGAELERLQVQAEHEWLHGLAVKLAHRAADPILIRNVRVFDSEHARRLPSRDVYVYRARIAGIVPAGATERDAASTVEGAGRVLIPVLLHLHAHAAPSQQVLQSGVGVPTS